MTLSRADQSLLAQWWFTIDRVLLMAIFVTMAAGLVISLAASPSVAVNKGLPAFYFVQRHILFAAIGAILIMILSLQSPATIRRIALVLFVGSLAGLIAVQFWGVSANGAQRWLRGERAAEAMWDQARTVGGHATLYRGGDRTAGVFQPLPAAMTTTAITETSTSANNAPRRRRRLGYVGMIEHRQGEDGACLWLNP